MTIEFITKQEFQSLSDRLDSIAEKLKEQKTDKTNSWIDNDQFMAMLSISKRTAQNYRDKGIISFSRVGKKIFYQLSDVNDFLGKYKIPAFNNKQLKYA